MKVTIGPDFGKKARLNFSQVMLRFTPKVNRPILLVDRKIGENREKSSKLRIFALICDDSIEKDDSIPPYGICRYQKKGLLFVDD